jgi:hypothetical protein
MKCDCIIEDGVILNPSYICVVKHVRHIIKNSLKKLFKEITMTYAMRNYVDFKRLPASINKSILSFIDYGDNITSFIHQYLSYHYFPYCCDEAGFDNVKKIVKHLNPFPENFNLWVISNRIFANMFGPYLRKCVNITMNYIVTDNTILSKPSEYFCEFDKEKKNMHLVSNYVKINYINRVTDLLCNAVIKGDTALIINLTHKLCVKFTVMDVLIKRNINYWKIIQLLTIHRYWGIELICMLLKKKNISTVKYLIKHKLIHAEEINLAKLACKYGSVELLEYLGTPHIEKTSIDELLSVALINKQYNVFIWIYMAFGITYDACNRIIYKLRWQKHCSREYYYMIHLAYTLFGKHKKLGSGDTSDDEEDDEKFPTDKRMDYIYTKYDHLIN